MKIIKADGQSEKTFIQTLKKRSQETDRKILDTVAQILAEVQKEGDQALDRYTLQFDGPLPPVRQVSAAILEESWKNLSPQLQSALEKAAHNIREFHSRQKPQSFMDAQENGVLLGQRVRGLERVGIYVPGGRAAYPSTVLMNAIPAQLAGVKELIMVTPPQKNGLADLAVLGAAWLVGIQKVYLVGGAQAVAALAYGTATIPQVDKIVGPGNLYVATAKKLLYGVVDIDMIAGPSEILILADKQAPPAFVAADLLSQAEHDPMASAMLVTDCPELVQQVLEEIQRQLPTLERRAIIEPSLENYGAVFLTENLEQSIKLANELAPEHLEVMTSQPMEILGSLHNAGSIFLGQYAPEPLGDYFAGPNHVLPTSFTARFFSPLSVDSFLKRSSFIYYPEAALREASCHIVTLARQEGLTAHANSIIVRGMGQ